MRTFDLTQVVEGVVTARGEYRSELTRTDLHRLWMQRGDENLARVLNFTPSGERVPILFATDQRQAAMHFSGLELSPDEIIVIGLGAASHHRSTAACRWGATSLTLEDLVVAGQAIIGRELTSPSFTHRIRPPSALFARPSSLHEAAVTSVQCHQMSRAGKARCNRPLIGASDVLSTKSLFPDWSRKRDRLVTIATAREVGAITEANVLYLIL